MGRPANLVQYAVAENGCWVWLLHKDAKGYGRVQREGRSQKAHRWMYKQKRGSIPGNKSLDHLCRNRACVNPDHLEPVDHVVNCRRGAATKLNHNEVLAIRSLISRGDRIKDIAAKFGVKHQAIYMIKYGRNWSKICQD